MVDISETSSNDQINGVKLLGSEGKMERIVSKIIWFEHLRLQLLLVFSIDVLTLADFDLSSVRNHITEYLIFFRQNIDC